MEQRSKLRIMLEDWILPAALAKALIEYRTRAVRKKTKTDPRRYWQGEPLSSAAANTPLFRTNNIPPRLITFGRESRDAAELFPQRALSLSLDTAAETFYRIGFASAFFPKLKEKVSVELDGEPVAALECLTRNEWHDVEIRVPAGQHQLSFRHNLPGPIWVSHPTVKKRASARAAKGVKDIIVLVVDSLSPDCLGLYGAAPSPMPHIDRAFASGTIYRNAYSQSEWTYPSIHSMVTGRYPMGHDANDPNSPTGGLSQTGGDSLAEQMRKGGYDTFCYSSAKGYSPAYGSNLGYNRFFNSPHWTLGPSHQQISRQAVIQLESNPRGCNFLFLHYLDAHEPWLIRSEMSDIGLANFRITDPAQEYEALKIGQGATKAEPIFDDKSIEVLKRRRFARLREVDLSIGELLNYIEQSGRAEATALFMLSDHGYSYPTKGQPLLCETRVHVPLLTRLPGQAGGVSDAFVDACVDLLPSVLQTAGLARAGEGHPFPLPAATNRGVALSESLYQKKYQAAVRDPEYVYHFRCSLDASGKIQPHANAEQNLFLRAREQEQTDLCATHPEELKRLEGVLRSHFAKHPERFATGARP